MLLFELTVCFPNIELLIIVVNRTAKWCSLPYCPKGFGGFETHRLNPKIKRKRSKEMPIDPFENAVGFLKIIPIFEILQIQISQR